jgi:hypothetical protein
MNVVIKPVHLVAAIGLIALIGIGYWYAASPGGPAATPRPPTRECGSDPGCLQQALAGGCAPATLSVDQGGIGFTAEVLGTAPQTTDTCLVKVKPTRFDPPDLPPEAAQSLGAVKPLLLASDMTCRVPLADVPRLNDTSYLFQRERLDQCDGSLKSFIELAVQRFGNESGG